MVDLCDPLWVSKMKQKNLNKHNSAIPVNSWIIYLYKINLYFFLANYESNFGPVSSQNWGKKKFFIYFQFNQLLISIFSAVVLIGLILPEVPKCDDRFWLV